MLMPEYLHNHNTKYQARNKERKMTFSNMTNRLYVTQSNKKDGQLEKVKVTPEGDETIVAILTPEEVRILMDEEGAVFDTIVAGTSKSARVIPRDKKGITTKITETDEDNLLKLPDIMSRKGEVCLTFADLKSWIRQNFPLQSAPGTFRTTRGQTVS